MPTSTPASDKPALSHDPPKPSPRDKPTRVLPGPKPVPTSHSIPVRRSSARSTPTIQRRRFCYPNHPRPDDATSPKPRPSRQPAVSPSVPPDVPSRPNAHHPTDQAETHPFHADKSSPLPPLTTSHALPCHAGPTSHLTAGHPGSCRQALAQPRLPALPFRRRRASPRSSQPSPTTRSSTVPHLIRPDYPRQPDPAPPVTDYPA